MPNKDLNRLRRSAHLRGTGNIKPSLSEPWSFLLPPSVIFGPVKLSLGISARGGPIPYYFRDNSGIGFRDCLRSVY